MNDDVLRELVLTVERTGSTCPVTLALSSAIQCGVMVRRSTYFDALEELAVETQRIPLKELARTMAAREEEPGQFVHLICAVLITGGQGLELTITSTDGGSLFTRRTPARVRVADVQTWQVASPFEKAVER